MQKTESAIDLSTAVGLSELAAKRDAIHEEIVVLGGKRGELEEFIARNEDLKEKVSALDVSHALLKNSVEDLEARKAELTKENIEKEALLRLLQDKGEDEKAKLASIINRQAIAREEFSRLDMQQEAKEVKSRKLEEGIKIIEEDSKTISASILAKIGEESALNSRLAHASAELASLKAQNSQEIAAFARREAEVRKSVESLEEKLSSLKSAIVDASAGVESAKIEAAGIIGNAEYLVEEAWSPIKAERIAMAEREGAVSLKESFIESKTVQLREVKLELEKAYGKPLSHIHI